ncbi:MAG TPA: tagaturonate epimerase family protein [Opitutaceae bacterium]
MKPINRFLVGSGLHIAGNPCISPDFCLDWPRLRERLRDDRPGVVEHPKSRFETSEGAWTLLEDLEGGDCAWRLRPASPGKAGHPLEDGFEGATEDVLFPSTWENLLRLKELIQRHDTGSTIFPVAGGRLAQGTIGVGARLTTLHWPAVEWTMSALEIGLTANQNSIPRELVYDVDAMLEGRLETVPFAFIGAQVPEGHQGQSVEGMSHGSVLSGLRNGFHRRRIPWSFNADHQPIGGPFDAREDALVRGCVLASYITFDLSPELALGRPADPGEVDPRSAARVTDRVRALGLGLEGGAIDNLMRVVWPAMQKMKRRDQKYRQARERIFSTDVGRRYMRELSIDELPGLTDPGTTAVMLALCEELGMPVDFIAPSFGFQKNLPYADNAQLRSLVERQWAVVRAFGASIGFHSGSGKSPENYRVIGEVTGGRFEVKTSGRYTYEMGVALSRSGNESDRRLWLDWYRFTRELALGGAFSEDPSERAAARAFIVASLERQGTPRDLFASQASCRAALEILDPSPDHPIFFEYNFLYILAGDGRPEKAALGDHTPTGYRQRARFYAVSPEARLRYAKGVAGYLILVAEETGLVPRARCAAARSLLARIGTYEEFLDEISR